MNVPRVYAGFIHGFLFGDIFEKGITVRAGQTHVHFLPELLGFIEAGKLQPQIIILHRLRLKEAAEAYKIFDQKQDHCRKRAMTP